MNIIQVLKRFSLPKIIILGLFVAGVLWFGFSQYQSSKTPAPQYTSTIVERGTLVTSVSSTGSITSGNNLGISTSATGTVNKVYVKNGDSVRQGQKIADITPDQDSLQRQASAWASYLSAKNSLETSKNKLNSLQASEFAANQKFINDAVARNLSKDDPTYIQENATWLQAENDYKNQYNAINQSQASLTSAWYSYQQVSSSITSPSTGIISNLMIVAGSIISAQSNSSSSQQLGTIRRQNENTQAQVTLSEIDATKVNVGQKVTILMDAFPDKTFSGTVTLVNTNGQVSSGVVSYPAIILFDTSTGNIYPNMGVNVKIITEVKDSVLLVPSSSVIVINGQKNLRMLKNRVLTNLPVQVGSSNDTQTEIISGINEGDSIITGVITSSKTTTTTQTTSPFSGLGGGSIRTFGGPTGR